MAKLPHTIKVEAQGVDKVKAMMALLDKYKDDLPLELQESLKEVADCDTCELGIKQMQDLGINPSKVFSLADKIEVKGLIPVNKVLKRLTVYINEKRNEAGFINTYVYPKRFTMVDEHNNTLVNW